MNVDDIINGIIQREGGYVDNPADRGGPTRYGITEAVARLNGYLGPMQDLPLTLAQSIYKNTYWINPGFDQIATLSSALAIKLMDIGVNMGVTVAATLLQRALNVLNRQGKLYADISADGHLGPQTLTALHAFLSARHDAGLSVLLRAIQCLQGARYIGIAEHTPADEEFIYGWLLNRVEI